MSDSTATQLLAQELHACDNRQFALWASVVPCDMVAAVRDEIDRQDPAPDFLKLNGVAWEMAHASAERAHTCKSGDRDQDSAERSPQQRAAEELHKLTQSLVHDMRDYYRAEAGDFLEELDELDGALYRVERAFNIDIQGKES